MSLLIKKFTYLLVFFVVFLPVFSQGQRVLDSNGKEVVIPPAKKTDSSNIISPRQAAIRSAILPGWGQVSVRKDLDASFFRKYYSIPVIYTAIGASAGIFAYNLTWYRRTRYAYKVLTTHDTANYKNVHRKLRGYLETNNPTALQYARNSYRKDLDYSALLFIAAWGLNVIHASVEAHLKSFDVSPDLSFHLKGGYSEVANTTGLSFVLHIK